jgi:hypothetical protein
MDSHVRGFSCLPSGKFFTRFADKLNSDAIMEKEVEKENFKESYKKGKLLFAIANKHLTLKNCGLNRYLEAGQEVVWARDGDFIYRSDTDLAWVDEFLQNEV